MRDDDGQDAFSPLEQTSPGANTGRNYPSDVRQNFLEACRTAGSTASKCRCALELVEQEFTLSEFVQLDAEMARTGRVSSDLQVLVAGCS